MHPSRDLQKDDMSVSGHAGVPPDDSLDHDSLLERVIENARPRYLGHVGRAKRTDKPLDSKKYRRALVRSLRESRKSGKKTGRSIDQVGHRLKSRSLGALSIVICTLLVTSAYASVGPTSWSNDLTTVMKDLFSLAENNKGNHSPTIAKDHTIPAASAATDAAGAQDDNSGGTTATLVVIPANVKKDNKDNSHSANADLGSGTDSGDSSASDTEDTNSDPSSDEDVSTANESAQDASSSTLVESPSTTTYESGSSGGTGGGAGGGYSAPASESSGGGAGGGSSPTPSNNDTSDPGTNPAASDSDPESSAGSGADDSVEEEYTLVLDTTPPTIIPPPDITAEATGTLTLVELGTPTVSDLEDPNPSVANNAPASGFPVGTTIVTWIAMDNHGNTATAIQLVSVVETSSTDSTGDLEDTVSDTTDSSNSTDSTLTPLIAPDNPPTIIPPPDITAEATGTLTLVELGTPTVSDLEDPNPSVANNAPASGFPVGTTVVTWTVIDTAGNVATATQKVTIHDTIPPEIIPPADIVAETSGTYTAVQLGVPVVSDIADISPVVTNNAPAEGFPVGNTTVTWLAMDASGNYAKATQLVTIIDPSIIEWGELRGVNFIDPVLRKMESHKAIGVQTSHVQTFIPKLKDMGFNLIRVPVYWEAYPGNEKNFLAELELIVKTAKENGIYVWIDFHHFDATSYWRYACTECGEYKSYGRGFPKSVVGQYHPTTDYEHDSEVEAFWNDYYLNQVRGVPDVWSNQADFMKAIIAKIDQYDNVVGYEILNEPHFFKSDHYSQMGTLQTEIGSKMREVTDKTIIFTRETGHHGFKRITSMEYLLLPQISGKIAYAPHLYNLDTIDTHIKNWKSYQKKWADMGYNVKIGVGEWAVQPPQTMTLTQAAMDGFIDKFKDNGFFWTYWAYGGFDMGEGNVLINKDGTLTTAGEYILISVNKYYLSAVN